jgi:Zinc knuckle
LSQASALTRDATSAAPATSSDDPRPDNRRFAQNRGTRRCFKCGNPDHIARDCNGASMPNSGPELAVPLRGIWTDGNRSEVYLSALLHQGSKVVGVDVTLDSDSFYSVIPAKYVN